MHEGDPSFDQALENMAGRYNLTAFQLVSAPVSTPLGALRNLSVASAKGEYLCQWDDDDLYHPERLSIQFNKMLSDHCHFSFMTDQLHLYERIGHVYWENWNHRPMPYNWIHGSVMGRKDHFPGYPQLKRGEDTGLAMEILDRDEPVSLLADHGYLYIYTYNGENTWDMRHHISISQDTRKTARELMALSNLLRQELPMYQLPYKKLLLPHDEGTLEIEC